MEPRPTPYNGPGFSMTKESLVAMGLTEEQATNTVKGADVRFLDVPFYAHLSNNFSMISWCVGYFAGTPLEEYSVVTPFWVTVIFDPGFMLTSGGQKQLHALGHNCHIAGGRGGVQRLEGQLARLIL